MVHLPVTRKPGAVAVGCSAITPWLPKLRYKTQSMWTLKRQSGSSPSFYVLSVCLSLCFCLSRSLSLCLYLCLSLSLSLCLSVYISVSDSLSLSVSPVSLPLSLGFVIFFLVRELSSIPQYIGPTGTNRWPKSRLFRPQVGLRLWRSPGL